MVALAHPERIGRYEVVGRLATGGMAEIFLARLTGPSGFERPVVVKRILPHLAHSPQFSAMFLDEARLVARIRHPNVVQVQELGEEGGELFLVMEYLEGESIGGVLRRFVVQGRSVPPALAAHVGAEACAGLHAAHELTDAEGYKLDLVHRDISPQNVFVLYSGGVRILDFGIAKAADRSTRTATGEIKGKFQYMSPEQCLGKPLDRRSDLFSLGVVLFELTTNRRLFKRANELLTFKAICEDPLPRPSELVPGYPPSLEKVLLKALARNPANRYETAAEMRRDLLGCMRELGATPEPAEELAELMRAAFADRISEKAELLRRVGAGSAPTRIPVNDADPSVELRDITEMASSVRSNETGERPKARRRLLAPGLALFALLAAAAGWKFGLARSTESSRPTPDPSAVAVTAPLASATPPAAPPVAPAPAATSVELSVSTKPAGAKVLLDGKLEGATPLVLALPPSTSSVKLEVRRDGFETVEKQIQLDHAQSFDLTLTPLPRGGGRPRTSSKKPPTGGEEVPLF